MIQSQERHSIRYFLASLAGIARALEDFGYRDEAGELFRIKQKLEIKVPQAEKFDPPSGT